MLCVDSDVGHFAIEACHDRGTARITPDIDTRAAHVEDAVKDQQIALTRLFAFLFPVIFMIANIGQAAILYFGGIQIVEATLTLGQWQEFSLYLVYLFIPIAQFGIVITQMGQA